MRIRTRQLGLRAFSFCFSGTCCLACNVRPRTSHQRHVFFMCVNNFVSSPNRRLPPLWILFVYIYMVLFLKMESEKQWKVTPVIMISLPGGGTYHALGFPKANRLLVQHLFIWTLLICLGHTTVWKSQEGIAKLGQGEDPTMHLSSILPLVGLIPHKWQTDWISLLPKELCSPWNTRKSLQMISKSI